MTHRQAFWRILVPQMWTYALPGLSNLWMVLIKATPLLFLLGVEDIVYWARELGGSKTARFHRLPAWRLADVVLPWRCWCSTSPSPSVSEVVLERITTKLSHGQATVGWRSAKESGMSCWQTLQEYAFPLARLWRTSCCRALTSPSAISLS